MKKIVMVVMIAAVLLGVFVSAPVFAGDGKEQARQKAIIALAAALDELNKALESELKEQKELAKKQEAEQKALDKQTAAFDKASSAVVKDLQEALAEYKKILPELDEDLRLLEKGL